MAAGARLDVTGTLDLSGGNDVLEVSGKLDPETVYTVATYGALTGTFDVVPTLPKHTLDYAGPGGTILLRPLPGGTVILVR